jgi:hypothetical protein
MTPGSVWLQFTAKTLSKQSNKALKDEKMEKNRLKKVTTPNPVSVAHELTTLSRLLNGPVVTVPNIGSIPTTLFSISLDRPSPRVIQTAPGFTLPTRLGRRTRL